MYVQLKFEVLKTSFYNKIIILGHCLTVAAVDCQGTGFCADEACLYCRIVFSSLSIRKENYKISFLCASSDCHRPWAWQMHVMSRLFVTQICAFVQGDIKDIQEDQPWSLALQPSFP